MLTDLLATLGLSEEEAKTYLALLKTGSTSAGFLAKHLDLPRPSVYGFLERLTAKGLVKQSVDFSGVKSYQAEPPEKVNMLFEQKIEQLQNRQVEYQAILPELEVGGMGKAMPPKFQLYEGQEGVKHVLKDMLLYRNMETEAFWPIKSMIEVLSADFFRYHNKQRIKNNLSIRAIWPKEQVVSIVAHPYLGASPALLRELRIAPADVDFSMGYWIYGNKAAFISSKRESFGFIIESVELVEMLKAQFEVIWRLSKALKENEEATKGFLEDLAKG